MDKVSGEGSKEEMDDAHIPSSTKIIEQFRRNPKLPNLMKTKTLLYTKLSITVPPHPTLPDAPTIPLFTVAKVSKS